MASSSSSSSSSSSAGIDLNLYSRQVGVFGLEAMGKLITLDVLVIGLRGVGVEAAKNLILAGPRSVTLFDPEPATIADCGSNVSGAAAAAVAAAAVAAAAAAARRGATRHARASSCRTRSPLHLHADLPPPPSLSPRSTTSRRRPWASRAPRRRSRSWAR